MENAEELLAAMKKLEQAIFKLLVKYSDVVHTFEKENDVVYDLCKMTRGLQLGKDADPFVSVDMMETFRKRVIERALKSAEYWTNFINACEDFLKVMIDLSVVTLKNKQMEILYDISKEGAAGIYKFIDTQVTPLTENFDEKVVDQLSRETVVDDRERTTRNTYPTGLSEEEEEENYDEPKKRRSKHRRPPPKDAEESFVAQEELKGYDTEG